MFMLKKFFFKTTNIMGVENFNLLLSAFPFSQGWPQRIIIFHIFLSLMSVSFAPTFSISSSTTSKNLLFGLPLFLFPCNSISIIFFPTCSWSLLMTCPYHLSLPSLIFIPNRSILTVLLMCPFLVFFCQSHSKPKHFYPCDFHLFHLFLCDCYCLKFIHHCWSYH